MPDRRQRTYALTEKALEYTRRYMSRFDEYAPAPVVRRELGVCPICLEEAELTWSGRMGLHPRPDGSGWCTSVGRKPVEAS